jgi:hypothetical protein
MEVEFQGIRITKKDVEEWFMGLSLAERQHILKK